MFQFAIIALAVFLIVFLADVLGKKGRPAPTAPAGGPAPRRPTAPTPIPVVRHDNHPQQRNGGESLPPRTNQPGNGRDSDGFLLDARKTVATFDFILRSLARQPAWTTPRQRENYEHDLAVMLKHGDLQIASLELLAADRTVLYRHRIQYQHAIDLRGKDAAQGIELPLLPPARIAEHRMTVSPVRQIATYRNELHLSWGDADKLQDRSGSQFASEHTRHVNRDRMTGQVFVSNEARRVATVITVSAAEDYAFARDPAFPADVYLHKAYCETRTEFRSGMRVSFIAIQTPRGIQGRNIRAAE